MKKHSKARILYPFKPFIELVSPPPTYTMQLSYLWMYFSSNMETPRLWKLWALKPAEQAASDRDLLGPARAQLEGGQSNKQDEEGSRKIRQLHSRVGFGILR